MSVEKNLQNLVLIGGGGHCKSCIDVIESTGLYQISGILDLPERVGCEVLHYPIVGTEANIAEYAQRGDQFLITLGQIKSAEKRKELYERLQAMGVKLATIISPRAYVSRYAAIGPGSIVMHYAMVNAGAQVGENCIINTGSLIEHDVHIGRHCHISTHAVINGDSKIGEEVLIGSHVTVFNQLEITGNVLIGAGSLVAKPITAPGTYVGNPCKISHT